MSTYGGPVTEEDKDRRARLDEFIAEGTHWDWHENRSGGNWWMSPRDYWNPSLRSVIDQDVVNKISRAYFEANNIKLVKR